MAGEPNIVFSEEDSRLLAAALARKHDAEAGKFAAEAEAARATVRKTDLELVPIQIAADKALQQRTEELTANKYHRVFTFNDSVNGSSVRTCIDQLTQWHRLDPSCRIEIVFNSPGGSVIDGLALFDYIQILRSEGHAINTSTVGYAASMAGILLQAGEKRTMGRQAWLLIHEASFGAGGKMGDVEDTVEWIKRIMDRVLDIFADRCAHAPNAKNPLTKRKIANKWRRKDWWISADEALDFGLIDEIGPSHDD